MAKRKANITETRQDRDAELGFVRPTYDRRTVTIPTQDPRHIGHIREGRIAGDAFQHNKPASTFGDDVKVVLTKDEPVVIDERGGPQEPEIKKARAKLDPDKAKSKKMGQGKARRGSGKSKGRPATHIDKQGERER